MGTSIAVVRTCTVVMHAEHDAQHPTMETQQVAIKQFMVLGHCRPSLTLGQH